ncbi:MAG: 4Fe-4S dicluster-binding protein [Thermodesulfobacteriota bacterium]
MPPRIDQEKCITCGQCIFICGRDVFAWRAAENRISPTRPQLCADCFVCSNSCPEKAIRIHRVKVKPS